MTGFPCIYCRRSDVPRTREHVLQAAFGATATLRTEVCGECNGAFSAIDKTFVEDLDNYVPKDKKEEQYLKKGWVLFEGRWMAGNGLLQTSDEALALQRRVLDIAAEFGY